MITELGLSVICLMILFVSFMGFVTENIWLAATKGYIDNRNMCLPFLLGYGLLMMTVYCLFGLPGNRFLYFLKSGSIVMVSEILLGYCTEKICSVEWWNYSWIPLHLTKYTSLPTTILFAAIITFFMDRLFLPLSRFASELTSADLAASVLPEVLLLVLFWDMLHSFRVMYRRRMLCTLWRIPISKKTNKKCSNPKAAAFSQTTQKYLASEKITGQ